MTIQTAIHLPEEVFERLKSLADASGQSPTDFMSKAMLEYVEDLEDAARAEAIMKKIEEGTMKTYSLDEVSRELGLDD
jgi:RHH-type transcriptional regulator, rel operon repressor / antitoxin RelB